MRHRAGLVQAGGKRHHAVARAAAVGWLDAGDAGEGGRLANRAAGIGASGRRNQPRRHGGSRAARRSAGNAAFVPRVFYGFVSAVFIARAHGELVAIELAQRDHAGAGQVADDGGIKRAAVVLQHLRGSGGREVARDKHVLVRQRHAQQVAAFASGAPSVGGARLRQRSLGVGRQKGAQAVMPGDAVQEMLG